MFSVTAWLSCLFVPGGVCTQVAGPDCQYLVPTSDINDYSGSQLGVHRVVLSGTALHPLLCLIHWLVHFLSMNVSPWCVCANRLLLAWLMSENNHDQSCWLSGVHHSLPPILATPGEECFASSAVERTSVNIVWGYMCTMPTRSVIAPALAFVPSRFCVISYSLILNLNQYHSVSYSHSVY